MGLKFFAYATSFKLSKPYSSYLKNGSGDNIIEIIPKLIR